MKTQNKGPFKGSFLKNIINPVLIIVLILTNVNSTSANVIGSNCYTIAQQCRLNCLTDPNPALCQLQCNSDLQSCLSLAGVGYRPNFSGTLVAGYPTPFAPGSVLPIKTNVVAVPSGSPMAMPGTITGVTYLFISNADLAAASSTATANWTVIGPGTYNGTSGTWDCNWNIPVSIATGGYEIAVIYSDPTLPGGQVVYGTHAIVSNSVPTLPEWGKIIFALLIVSAGSVMIRRRKLAFAGAEADSNSINPVKKISFGLIFGIVLIISMLVLGICLLYYKNVTLLDLSCTLICVPLVSVIIHKMIGK